jgi:hypothetical protein
MTTPNGPIVFNSTDGSDTAASGLGPSVALTGNGASTTGSSAVVTGISTTGVTAGDLLWVQSSSGRQFSIIASVDSSTQVTCDDVFANTESGRTWAIGGKRATWDNADSRQSFTDSQGWTFETETDQTLTSHIACPPLSGTHTIQGANNALRTITQTADDDNFRGNINNNSIMIFRHLKLENSNASKTNAYGLGMRRRFYCFDCVFGDPVNQLKHGQVRRGDYPNFTMERCIIQNCTDAGLDWGYYIVVLKSCLFRNNATYGFKMSQTPHTIVDCIFENNGTSGILVNIGAPRNIHILGCIFYGNASHGMDKVAASYFSEGSLVRGCIFANNGGYAVNANVTGDWVFDGNVYYNNTLGISNQSHVPGPNDITLSSDPFVDAANGDFNLNTSNAGGRTLRAANYTIGE